MTSHLWFTPTQLDELRRLRDAGEPHLCAVLASAQQEAQRRGEELYPATPHPKGLPHVREEGRFLSAQAILALLHDQPPQQQQAAADALACYRFITSDGYPSDLGVGAWALEGSMLIDATQGLVSAEDQDALYQAVYDIFSRLRTTVTKGNPHTVNNNWWAITHGGCLLAGLALHGRRRSDGTTYDCSEGIHWARQRLHAFCHHFGAAGLYHEGLGYQGYTMSMLFPALLADQNHGGPRVLDVFPHLGNAAASLYASVVAVPPTPDQEDAQRDGRQLGMQLSWNDAGSGHNGGIQEIAMIALAPESQRGALRGFYDALHGIHGDRSFSPGFCGMYLAATLYPYQFPAVPPAEGLPTFVADNRQGLIMARSGYQGADDRVLGVYARATHVGGHSADDAGSLRLIALGHDWIVGGGQARGRAVWQSVVVDDTGERPKPTPCGAVFWREATAAGAIMAMDLRKVQGAYAERHLAIDYSGACGAPVALAMLDQIDDHRDDRGWLWNLSFAPDLQAEIDADGCGFRLLADDGAQLQARFLAAQPTDLRIEDMPASKRSYANGEMVHYRQRRFIQAAFAAQSPLAIYVGMTVSQGPVAAMHLAQGTDIAVGEHLWQRPFGADLPAEFTPGRSRGVCPHPAG